jgi:DNA-binding PadR family transcriptional regulator
MSKAMQEPTFLILTALADGPQHGYGIISDAERISAGRTRLRAGTLYAALDRLQSDGLIAADREEIVDGRLRRYYRLTDDGAAALAAEVEALRRRTEVAARRLASPTRLHRGASPA